jgi:hypothetical protein
MTFLFENVIELAESEILNDGKKTMVPEISERASRPSISEKYPEAREEAIQHSVRCLTVECTPGKPLSAP